MNTPNDPMAEIRASFFIECEELLEALQDGLQIIEDGTDDTETINVVFRAVHSIKGGAGAFGLDGLVRFAHRFETVLDEVRTGRMQIESDVLKLFFQATDHLSDLVRISRDAGLLPDAATNNILTQLDALLGGTSDTEVEPEIEFQPMGISLDIDLDSIDDTEFPNLNDLTSRPDLANLTSDQPDTSSALPTYTIHFAPLAEMFETGNEPFLLLRNLRDLGKTTLTCNLAKVPDLKALTPELPYMCWDVKLETNVDAAEIASIFEFVEGLCILKIQSNTTPPDNMDFDVAATTPQAPLTASNNLDVKAPPMETKKPTTTIDPLANATQPTPATEAKSVVRVDLDRIERLVNLVGELVINQAMLSQSLEQSGLSPHSDAMNGLEEFQRLTRNIQDSVMMIRAQPVKSLFQRMSRIVREASNSVEKDVRLHSEGEATEVDKTVIERLADPLTHMIRNAVDHGLETTQARLAAGKPAQGRVNLTAAHRSGRVIIEVSDDGAGINRSKVLEIAISKGLIAADAQLSDAEIDNLLFLPGFSTASVVSDLSGRGVGMDVVRTAIQALGGRITITSAPNVGTTFSISLPLTLAVLDGMVVDVAGETLVLPLNLVVETLTLSQNDVEIVRPGNCVMRVRGTFIPLFDLGLELGYRPPLTCFEDVVVLLIAHDDGSQAALMIDNIVDQRQVVIKGLDESFYRAPGIAAATILGDGQIALILDPSDIITNAMRHPAVPSTVFEAGIPA
ncbi:MAG: chemotaxis protein CheA [Sulfitobacter sp.]